MYAIQLNIVNLRGNDGSLLKQYQQLLLSEITTGLKISFNQLDQCLSNVMTMIVNFCQSQSYFNLCGEG